MHGGGGQGSQVCHGEREECVGVNVGNVSGMLGSAGRVVGPASYILLSWALPARAPEFRMCALFCVTGMVLLGHLPVTWL